MCRAESTEQEEKRAANVTLLLMEVISSGYFVANHTDDKTFWHWSVVSRFLPFRNIGILTREEVLCCVQD
jgi:hypothetical protein